MYTIKETVEALKSGKTTSVNLVKDSVETFEKDKASEKPLNAFLELYADAILKAEEADKEIEKAKNEGKLEELFEKKPLLGIPFANKDNISSKGHKLTCGSKILQGYTAPYNATVVSRLEAAGAIPLGRCNQDEFAMGSSTEYSSYGATRNPINREYVSGGSSGGSAAAVRKPGFVLAWNGNRRLGPSSGFLLRNLRLKADLRRFVALGSCRLRFIA